MLILPCIMPIMTEALSFTVTSWCKLAMAQADVDSCNIGDCMPQILRGALKTEQP